MTWKLEGNHFVSPEGIKTEIAIQQHSAGPFIKAPAGSRLCIADGFIRSSYGVEEILAHAAKMVEKANHRLAESSSLIDRVNKDTFAKAGVNGLLDAHLYALERELERQVSDTYVQAFKDMHAVLDKLATGEFKVVKA